MLSSKLLYSTNTLVSYADAIELYGVCVPRLLSIPAPAGAGADPIRRTAPVILSTLPSSPAAEVHLIA